jgi:hypothetical protein
LEAVQTFKLPENKNNAETVVMTKFVGLTQQSGQSVLPVLHSPAHFPTDHGPDFEVYSKDGTLEYFELCEIAPLVGKYEDADRIMLVGDWVKAVVERVENKVANYGKKPGFRPISLLLYVTHDHFSPSPLEVACARDALQGISNGVFKSIYLEIFAHDGNPLAMMLSPFAGRSYTKSQLTGHMRRQMVRPDPAQVQIIDDKSSGDYVDVTVRQYLPLGTDISKLKVGAVPEGTAVPFNTVHVAVRSKKEKQ